MFVLVGNSFVYLVPAADFAFSHADRRFVYIHNGMNYVIFLWFNGSATYLKVSVTVIQLYLDLDS